MVNKPVRSIVQRACNELIPGTVPAAAAAMRENNQHCRVVGNGEMAIEYLFIRWNFDLRVHALLSILRSAGENFANFFIAGL